MLRRYGLLALPAIGLMELAAHLFFAARAPAFDEYPALAAPVAAMRQPGDLVVMTPAWAEPLARRAVGDSLMPLRDVARPSESGYEGVVEVSMLGQRDEAFNDWSEVERREVGDFTLRRMVNHGHEPEVFDFVDALDPRAVRVSVGDARCMWTTAARASAGGLGGPPAFPRRRFVCPGSPFFFVGVTVIADQDFRARRCLWAHPPNGAELRIRYRNVSLGDTIVGHGGMYWITERERRGTPIGMRVEVNGSPIGQVTHADGDGWSRFELPVGEHAGSDGAEVVFAVSSVNAEHRHFCFEARSR